VPSDPSRLPLPPAHSKHANAQVTHRTYFIEVLHESEPYTSIDGQSSVAKFRLEAHLLDLVRSTPAALATPTRGDITRATAASRQHSAEA